MSHSRSEMLNRAESLASAKGSKSARLLTNAGGRRIRKKKEGNAELERRTGKGRYSSIGRVCSRMAPHLWQRACVVCSLASTVRSQSTYTILSNLLIDKEPRKKKKKYPHELIIPSHKR